MYSLWIQPTTENLGVPTERKFQSSISVEKISQTQNKRAHRILGRSPEKKVKGQGEAIILL